MNMLEPIQLTRKDFASDQTVRWCPGCGDYAILAQVQKTMPEIGVPKEWQIDFGSSDEMLRALSQDGPTRLTKEPMSWQEAVRRTVDLLRNGALA